MRIKEVDIELEFSVPLASREPSPHDVLDGWLNLTEDFYGLPMFCMHHRELR
jgi:hypothetical protein